MNEEDTEYGVTYGLSTRYKKERMIKSRVKAWSLCSSTLRESSLYHLGRQSTRTYTKKLSKHQSQSHPCPAEIWWRLQNDSSPSYTVVNSYLTRIGVSTVPQSPYSPDVDLADFFLFPRVKYELKGKYLETLDNIPKTTTKCLYRILRSEFHMAMIHGKHVDKDV
ncbi:hypothetical protein LAZ67_4002242 [Cordylochernes scorpioides]|uniref:Uncharacterized protein n=1 Tax=Cordylochernes scorpioides TaxID=51811 RepID=A0ABY6KDD1_9ARAC|nr:hypothetical protein LAZ67_4002242 [Cordylochernes scorpioides]